MADSYVTTLIIMTVLILTPLFIGLFLYIKGYSLSDIWKKAVDIFLKNKKAIIITVAIICSVLILFGVVGSAKKTSAINEIQNEIEVAVAEAYEGDYAVRFGLKNIDVSVNNIDNYLGEYHAYIVIRCDVENSEYDREKEDVGRDIMDSLPEAVETRAYGSVSIKNILYKPENDTYGVAIFINGKQYYKHGKTFSQLEKEAQWEAEYKKEKEYEEKYDDVMAGYDWGDDYYYDTNDHEVKKKPW